MNEGQEELARLRAAIAATGDVVYDWDLVNDAVLWSGRAAELLGRAGTLVGDGDAFNALLHPEDLARRLKALSHHFTTHEPFDCEYRLCPEPEKTIWVHNRAFAQFDANGRPIRMVGTLRGVTARKQKEAELEYQANFDQLTGQLNYPRLRAALDQAITYSIRYDVPGAYLTIGIDKLSLINDAYGPNAADSVIVDVGRRLKRSVRAGDVVGRVSGDRFGVVFANCPPGDIAAAAEKILQAILYPEVLTPAGPIHVTVSAGGVSFPTGAHVAQDAMTKADIGMQEAKRSGRNCFVPYSGTEAERVGQRQLIFRAKRLQMALRSDELFFAYQPVVASAGRGVDHYECLIRMRDEDGTVLNASEFVPVAEQLGLMRQMDRRVLEMAVTDLENFGDARLAINISGLTPADPGWLQSLTKLLSHRPEMAKRLTLEITETTALRDVQETAQFVDAAHRLGCRVSLDDFGAGYTSFRHLKDLRIDCVKIDGTFVRDISHSRDNQLFVKTLVGLAQGFHLDTVAECVESEPDAELLVQGGVGFLQGFHCGAPATIKPWEGPLRQAVAANDSRGT